MSPMTTTRKRKSPVNSGPNRLYLKKKRGCAEKPFNWERIEERMSAGCTATEIAGIEGVCLHTFLARFQKVKGVHFSQAIKEKIEGRNGSLRWKQFQKAMQGNVQLLIKLGEVYLGQGKEVQAVPNDAQLDQSIEVAKKIGELEAIKIELAEIKKRFGLDVPESQASDEPLSSNETI